MNFDSFNLHPDIMNGLDAMGYKEATPVQEQAIPIILQKKDLIACAQTGTGKTAAFLLPTMHNILQAKPDGINTLIIAPTRELAKQIDRQVEGLAYFASVSSIPVYGGGDGVDFGRQQNALKQGVDMVIATPGKLLSHLNLGYVNIGKLQHLILDEADKMLDMGFFEDIMRIIGFLPKERQTLMFSATMPDKIRAMAKEILRQPEQINIALSKPAEGVMQVAYVLYDNQKDRLLHHLLKGKKLKSVIVFAGTKSKVREVAKYLKSKGHAAADIQSDLEQETREDVLRQFKAHNLNILVATDILSRGIDIKNVELIINYDVPQDAEDYVHRVGRTARAQSTGVAITLINPKDQRRFHRIETLIEKTVLKSLLPPEIGEGPAYEPQKRPSGGGGGRFRGRGGNGKGSYGGRRKKGGGGNKRHNRNDRKS